MSGPLRFEHPGAIHHVMNRGTRKAAIFHDDEDRRFFMRRLRLVADRRGWRCLAYCLMTNHVHLVIETTVPTLGAGMRDLESLYARVFNDRHDFGGTMLQGRYRSRLVTSDEYLAQLLRYVALNPVKAGLARAPAAWGWSSHRALLGQVHDPCLDVERVAELLAPWGGSARDRYGRLFDVDGPLAMKYGDEDPGVWRPPLAELFAEGDRRQGVQQALRAGYRPSEIAAHLGVARSTVSRLTRALEVAPAT